MKKIISLLFEVEKKLLRQKMKILEGVKNVGKGTKNVKISPIFKCFSFLIF